MEAARDLRNGILNEDNVENVDETHLEINVYNGKTLALRGDQDVKYVDATSGGEGMAMMVRISAGKYSIVQPPLMIYKKRQ